MSSITGLIDQINNKVPNIVIYQRGDRWHWIANDIGTETDTNTELETPVDALIDMLKHLTEKR